MISDVIVTIDDSLFNRIATTAQKSPGLMGTAFKREVRRIRKTALARLHEQPGPVKRPIRWTSACQRCAFFATNGFGRGIPTKRTGKLVEAWRVEYVDEDDAGVLRIYNPSPVEQYVTGVNQQGFHRDTGWYYSPDILADLQVEAQERLEETWLTVADPFAGVPR